MIPMLIGQEELTTKEMIIIAIVLVVLFFLFVVVAVFLSYARWWIQAFFTKAKVSFFDLLGMSFRILSSSLEL